MLKLNLPPFSINIKRTAGKLLVFDSLRCKFVALTPEEWVRQHFIHYLVEDKKYPKSLLANEIQIKLNNQKRRCDTVVYNRDLSPLVIIEYKAAEVKITQEVVDQIARYNSVLKVQYLILSNGLTHYCCKINYELQTYEYLVDIPFYEDICKG